MPSLSARCHVHHLLYISTGCISYLGLSANFAVNNLHFSITSDIESSDDDSSSERDEIPWQQIWLSADSDLDYDALRRENNWSVCVHYLTI